MPFQVKEEKTTKILQIFTQKSTSSSSRVEHEALGVSTASSLRANLPRMRGRLSASVFRHAYCYHIIRTNTHALIQTFLFLLLLLSSSNIFNDKKKVLRSHFKRDEHTESQLQTYFCPCAEIKFCFCIILNIL